MRAVDNIHVEWVEDEAVVLDSSTGQLHYLNTPAALVLALIQEHGYEAGVQELKKQYPDNPRIDEDLPALLDELKERGLVVDD